MKPGRVVLFALALATAACGAAAPAKSPAAVEPAPQSAATTPPPQVAPPPKPPGEACGPLECRAFDSPLAAFRAVLDDKPMVLAVGEAHAQKGTEQVDSAVHRFTELFLPALSGQASDLIVELLAPRGDCEAKKREVAKRQKPVTEPQAEKNQNEYLKLGHRARAIGIVPDILRPTCQDLERITSAGAGDISVMLETIARLTQNKVASLIDKNRQLGGSGMVVAYGGALHNDLAPRAGREAWSFGPALARHTGEKYVELDLIVPEYIKDTESWRAFSWVEHYDRARHGQKAVLYKTGKSSYVLIFPLAKPAP